MTKFARTSGWWQWPAKMTDAWWRTNLTFQTFSIMLFCWLTPLFLCSFMILLWCGGSKHVFVFDLHNRRPNSRVSKKHFHLCHLLMATSDWPQTPATTSVKTLPHQIFWRAFRTTVMAQSREPLWNILKSMQPFKCICLRCYCFKFCLIRSEFAVNKLRKSGFKGGSFLLRQSPKNYDNFFLTVCVQVKNMLPINTT